MHNIKVHYLFNSGFSVETEKSLIIFDYFRNDPAIGEKSLSNGVVGPKDLMTDKDIYVLSSHNHGDHFNRIIFKWQQIKKEIHYILSSDIPVESGINAISMPPDEEIFEGNARIRTLGSTDIGVSFLIKIDGVSLFHAGDLNWWYWWDDTPSEIEAMEKAYKQEITKLKGEKIDIAFFPVDPRLRENYYLGGEYFIKEVVPKYFFPMHFGNKYSATSNFAERMKSYPSKVMEISQRGQEFIL